MPTTAMTAHGQTTHTGLPCLKKTPLPQILRYPDINRQMKLFPEKAI